MTTTKKLIRSILLFSLSNKQTRKLAFIAKVYNLKDYGKPQVPNGWTKVEIFNLIMIYCNSPLDFNERLNAFLCNAKTIIKL